MRKLIYLSSIVVMLITATITIPSCEQDWEEYGAEQVLEPQLSVAEARSFFERYAAEISISQNPTGMAPGNFAPQWDKAVAHTTAKRAYADVPIVAERTHTAYFAKDNAATLRLNSGYYKTAVAQRLVVGKITETGELDCAIATIIPAAEHATLSHERVQKMFVHDGAAARFSGVVVYSSVASYSTFAVSKYVGGKVVVHESAFNRGKTDEENLLSMAALVRQVQVGTRTVRTKMWTMELPEIEISGGGDGNSGGGGGWGSDGGNNSGSGDGTVDGGTLDEIVVPGYGSGGNNGGGGGGSVWTPPTIPTPPYIPPGSNVSKIFNTNNSMSTDQWADVENMLNKLMQDCAGKMLYDKLLGSSINFVLDPNLSANGRVNYSNNTLSLKSLQDFDDVLFHELAHIYQGQGKSGAANNQNLMNYEVEANILQYIYINRNRVTTDAGRKRIGNKYKRENLGENLDLILGDMDSKGNIVTSTYEFNKNFAGVMTSLRNSGYPAHKYPYNPSRYAQPFLHEILSNC